MDKVKKIGVVVVTHGNYGQSLLDAAMAILGSQDRASAVGIDMSTAVEEILGRIRAAVQAAEAGAGVLILTDMFGGTPTNLSLSLLGTGRLEVITGVNLPMLLKVLSGRERPLGALSAEARDAGCKGIVVAGEVLRSKIAARK
jgi:PTS system mannose-specific IIA component